MSSRHFSVKSGKAGTGGKHAAYIEGVGKYAERDDVQYCRDHNLPEWANDGRDFFEAADKLERANGRAYTEIEAAIPRGVDDPVAYAIAYAEKTLGKNHPYRLAVHDKLARDGGRNVHMHLMFSDRKLDGIERPREQFFKRAAAPYRHRTTKEMMPADPTKGGAAKDRKWNERATVQALRQDYSAHAQKYGIELDLRSNLAQGLGAPEQKIGPAHQRAEFNQARELRLAEVHQLRQVRKEIHQVQTEIHRQEKENARATQHQKYVSRTAAPRRDSVPRMHERRHYSDAERAQHLLPGNAFDRVGEQQAKEQFDRVLAESKRASERVAEDHKIAETNRHMQKVSDLKMQAWRGQLANRRKDWQRPAIKLTTVPAKAGQPIVHRWDSTMGKAAGFAAVIDYGDRLKPAGRPENISDNKVRALLMVAHNKGWKEIRVTGDQDFRQRVAIAAIHAGIGLLDADLKTHVAPIVQAREAAEATRKANAETLAKAEAERQAKEAARQLEKARREEWAQYAKRLDALALERGKPPEQRRAIIQGLVKHCEAGQTVAEYLEKLKQAERKKREQAERLQADNPELARAKSREQAVAWAAEHGYTLYQTETATCHGRVVRADAHHAIQDLGQKTAVLHEQRAFERPLTEGETARVIYPRDGLPIIVTQPEQPRVAMDDQSGPQRRR